MPPPRPCVHGPGLALARMDAVAEALDGYPYLHASRADMLRRLGRTDEARAAYQRALELTGNASERRFLQRASRNALGSPATN